MRIYGDNGLKIELPTGNVDDVKINGTSILSNKVANIPIPDNGHGLGVIGTHSSYGLQTIRTGSDIGLIKGVVVDYSTYTNGSSGFILSKGTLENVLTEKGFLTENEAVTKTATGTQTIQSALFVGGLTSDVSFGNAITHQRKLLTPDPQGRTLYGAGFQLGNPSCACELITKTWDDAGAHPYNTAILRMSPSGLSFGINGAPSTSHRVPTEAEFKTVAIADDLSLNKSSGDLLLKHGATTVSTLSGAIPTKTSDLTNDSGFITSTSLPTKVSDLLNDSGFLTTANIATSLTPGVIKSGYQLNVASDGTTSCGTLTKTSYSSANTASFISKGTLDNILTDYALSSDVPVKISDLTDDSNFIEDTDYATTSKGGTIKISDLYCTDIYNGVLMAKTISASDLDTANSYAFVSMQTMRNQLYKYLTTEQADNTFATKSSLSSAMTDVYSALNSGLSSVASNIPRNTSDLTNDSGFISLPWYYASEGPTVDASVAINNILTRYGKVLLGPETYYIKKYINLEPGCCIEGCGPNTIIKWVDTGSNNKIIIYVNSSTPNKGPERVTILNLCLQGIADSEVSSNIIFTSDTVPDRVPYGIRCYRNNTTTGTSVRDHPIVVENVIMENLAYGYYDEFYLGYDTNTQLTPNEYEPVSSRLAIRNCTFRNCYYGYYDYTSASDNGGGVSFDNCLFNRTRTAMYVNHFGYYINNCSFYHSYYRTIESSSSTVAAGSHTLITVNGCRFYTPAVDDVSHIYIALYYSTNALIKISDTLFNFGKLIGTNVRHIYVRCRTIMNNCQLMMRATGSTRDNGIVISLASGAKINAIMNSWTDTAVKSTSGQSFTVYNSFKDDGTSFVAS